MNKPVNNLLGLLLLIGCIAYLFGIGFACVQSWSEGRTSYELPAFLSNTLTSISALFSTNLGAILGISAVKNNTNFNDTATWNPAKTWRKIKKWENPSMSEFQVILCYVYIFALFSCSIVWAHRSFETDVTQVNTIIPEMTKSLLGVVVGVLAFSLNNNGSNVNEK